MARIELVTEVGAPPERCFDLSRSIDLHVSSATGTGERPVAGVTSGLIGLGQEVTWVAKHLGMWQSLTARITAYDRPAHFRDSQVRGAFARFDHDHHFEATPTGTRMRDVFDFDAPFGPLGRLAELVFLRAYMERFLRERNRVLREVAEGDGWRRYLASA